MHKRIIIGFAIALLLILTVAIWVLPSRQPVVSKPRDFAVSFVGFANTNNGTAAIFSYTNGTGLHLMVETTAVEYQSNGVWHTAPAVLGMMTSSPSDRGSWLVAIHTTNVSWRMRVLCVEPATGVAGAVDKATDAVKSVANSGKLGTHFTWSGREYEVVSSDLTR